jgi:dimethylhistidine N-methyltransferase
MHEPGVAMKAPHCVQIEDGSARRLRQDALEGLLQPQAEIAPKFFYDGLGSRLFDAITELEAYYLTRTEAAIFDDHAAAMARAVHAVTGPHPALVDLGAGNCAKAARLFGVMAPRAYVAVDISVDYLQQALRALQREHPALDISGVGMDFSARLDLPHDLPGVGEGPRLLFYPGSSIGNFSPQQALALLGDMHRCAQGGALLIGVDLLKSPQVLQAAYDDDLGVTAAFNLNALRHLNARLGSDFRVRQWQHVALFNEAASRIEMHLQAREALVVTWPGGQRAFRAGERMHTENSYKWTPAQFMQLLRDAGFTRVQDWRDPQDAFGVFLASG